MGSPLYPYINSSGIYTTSGGSTVVTSNGRLSSGTPTRYYVRLFLKREQSSGTTTSGASEVPSNATSANIMPGFSGHSFLYRGYVLQHCQLPSSSEFKLGDPSNSLVLSDTITRPEWLLPTGRMEVLFGDLTSDTMKCKVIITSGSYGQLGIDELIIQELRGVPITLVGANYSI